MPHAAFVIPGDIELPTGGYAYDRRVLALLPQFGVAVDHLALPGSYPSPSAADLVLTGQALASAPAFKSMASIAALPWAAASASAVTP